MRPLLHDLFHAHIGMAFDHQLRFADLCQEQGVDANWHYKLDTAVLTLGGMWTLTAPLIGSHAEESNTWMWAWANRHLKLPIVGKRLAARVKRLSGELPEPVFAAAGTVGCDELFGEELAAHAAHAMGAIVSQSLGYDAYYTVPYPGGRGATVLREKRLRRMPEQPLVVICSRFTQLISALPIPDQRLAFLGYAASYGLTATAHGQSVRVVLPKVGELLAKFDRKNRLSVLKSQTVPTKPPGSKGPPNPRPKQKPRLK
jgi:hypothetical protein